MKTDEKEGTPKIPYERHELILNKLKEVDLLKIDELAAFMPDVSMSTLRRDLKELEKRGSIEYLTGGAVKLHSAAHEASVFEKGAQRSSEKDLIARCAAAEVEDGETVYVDSGTTATALLSLLVDKPVTIYTTNGYACWFTGELAAKVVVIGGDFNPVTCSLTGPMVESALRELYFDRAFIGVNAVDEDRGIMTPGYPEAIKKRIVMQDSQASYVLADSSKFHVFSNVKVCDLEGFTVISDKRDAKIGERVKMITA